MKRISCIAALMLACWTLGGCEVTATPPGMTSFHDAARRGDLNKVKTCLAGGADVNSKELETTYEYNYNLSKTWGF